jgi:hypothetical protein
MAPKMEEREWPVKDVSSNGLMPEQIQSIRNRFTNIVVQIVYTSIVGTVMLLALLEWFLWLAAFLYCLVKVYVKAEHWSSKVLAIVVGSLFTALR